MAMTAITIVIPFLALSFAIGLWSNRWSRKSWTVLVTGTLLILAVNIVLVYA
jgi:hypothetical protein